MRLLDGRVAELASGRSGNSICREDFLERNAHSTVAHAHVHDK